MKLYKLLLGVLLAFSLTLTATGCGSNASSVSAKTNDGVGSDNPDEFTIRIGVNSLDNNFLLKILDNHTDFLKDKGINLETTEFSAGINDLFGTESNTMASKLTEAKSVALKKLKENCLKVLLNSNKYRIFAPKLR